MRRARLVAAMLALMAGCSSEPKPPSAPASVPAARPSPPQPPPAPAPRPAPPPVSVPVAPVSTPPPPPPDQCGAWELTGLIGKPRSEIPVPVNPARRRVVCTTCPRTQDFSPTRLTIEYDAVTGKVTKLGCN